MAALFIGTSNVVVPGNKTSFPPAFHLKSRLHYYSTLFNSVEINSSFYKLPRKITFEKWAQDTGDDFKFSVKLSKDITHAKELSFDRALIEKFITAAEGMGKKKGCLLIQFPGKVTMDHFNSVEMILQYLQEADVSNAWKAAVEFRHPSWYIAETYELLDEYNCSMTIHDMPKAKSTVLNKKASFVYLRFHGPAGDYTGSYTDSYLGKIAEQIKDWLKKNKEVYVYFNNTMGAAYDNALLLKKYCSK